MQGQACCTIIALQAWHQSHTDRNIHIEEGQPRYILLQVVQLLFLGKELHGSRVLLNSYY